MCQLMLLEFNVTIKSLIHFFQTSPSLHVPSSLSSFSSLTWSLSAIVCVWKRRRRGSDTQGIVWDRKGYIIS